MPTPTPTTRHLLHAALLTTFALAAPARADDCDEKWLTDLGVYGLGGSVYTTTLWDPDGPGAAPSQLVAVGNFYIFSSGTWGWNSVARWVDNEWRAFPHEIRGGTFNTIIHTTAALPDGTLVIGGEFAISLDGRIRYDGAAFWDGTFWQPFGPGSGLSSHGPRKLALLDDGSLVGLGSLPVSETAYTHIGIWDGPYWRPLLSNWSIFNPIETMVPHGNDILIGGRITNGLIQGSEDILRWSGPYPGTWTAFPPPGEVGIASQVNAITTLPNGDIIAGGRLSADGTHLIARWNGASWTPMNAGLEGVQEISTLYTRPDGTIFAGTRHRSPAAPVPGRLLRWNGAAWETMATLPAGQSVLTIGPGPDGSVVAAGQFNTITQDGVTQSAHTIARFGVPVPVIDPIPQNSVVCPRGTATFSVGVREPDNDTFQWQIRDITSPTGWRSLDDGAADGFTFSGTTTAQISITADDMFTAANLPEFRVLVSNACGTSASRSRTIQPCPADWDCSGGVDGDDIAAFFTDWQQGSADADMSGATDADDIPAFFNAWQRGQCLLRW